MALRTWKLITVAAVCFAAMACERDPVLLRAPIRGSFDASVACGPNAVQVGVTPSGPVCDCLPGFFPSDFGCVSSPSDCANDLDTGIASFVISHLGLPVSDGFDVDGLNNAPPPGGSGPNVAGCGNTDIPGGIDNRFTALATSLASLSDTRASLQASLARDVHDGGATGPVSIFVIMSQLAAGNAAHDACVDADLVVSVAGRPLQTVHASGALSDNVFVARFPEPFTVPYVPVLPPAACVDSACVPAMLGIPIRGAHVRLLLDAAHLGIRFGSKIGGFVFFNDCTGSAGTGTGCAGGAFETVNASGFEASLESWGLEANLVPSFESMWITAYAGARDLHMNPDGTLSPCSGSSTLDVDANAISVAFTLDSE